MTTNRKKKKRDRGHEFLETVLGERRAYSRDKRGVGSRHILLAAPTAVVADPKTGKTVMSKILNVEENPSNPNYARRNVITKQTIIKTEAGLARVTNSPARDAVINAVLIEKK